MVPFNLQLEIGGRLTTLSAEQLDQLADETGFMRYQVRSFNHNGVIHVNIEDEPLPPEEAVGFNLDETFALDDVKKIAQAIREYNSSRKLNFDQMHFDF
ncbi:hypothetical protein SAMN05216464_105335 [Mucilaginibacter pineti]|uniref:Uncharacterized protein n=1 Tax=Mucilaginibacter pineti TaxID=1391627 RepID=A0A1G7C8U4_9SPHI|nr:hypothetical protein [Mucilaginibacter pineti]SDE35739.1 hypothetical protein SAMN05216464_105335 [Mucilaginibacter pineti]